MRLRRKVDDPSASLLAGLQVFPAFCVEETATAQEDDAAKVLGNLSYLGRKDFFMDASKSFLLLLFLLVVNGMVVCGAEQNLPEEHQKAIAEIEKLGGRILTEVTKVSFSKSDITDAGLEHLTRLTSLQRLHLNQTQITDAGLEHLKGLNKLCDLDLSSNIQITVAVLKHLKELTSLKRLSLSNTQITEDDIKKLQEALPKCKIEH